MLIVRGVVVDVQSRDWEMNGKAGVTQTVYLRDSADEPSRFAAQPVKLGKQKDGEDYSPIPVPAVGDEVEYRVRIDFRTGNDGSAKLRNFTRFDRQVQEQDHGFTAVEILTASKLAAVKGRRSA